MSDSGRDVSGPIRKLSGNALADLKHNLLDRIYQTYQIAPTDQQDLETAILEVIAGCLFRESSYPCNRSICDDSSRD